MTPDIVVPMMVFGMPVAIYFLKKYFQFREKQLEAGTANPRLLEAVRSEYAAKQRELEARIENLETALIAVDSDLEHRLGSQKRAAALAEGRVRSLPAPPRTDG